jgi:hypothetical protein
MLAALSDRLSLGAPSAHGNLALRPILLNGGPLFTLAVKSLEQGLAEGTFRVTEISAEGRVPELRVRNSGETAVLMLDGEELVGAKQDRIVNVTILAPPQSETIIPVSCIEAGRWGYSRPNFTAAGRVLSQNIRYCKAEAVTRSLKKQGIRSSDQRAVWEGVSRAFLSLGAASPTNALSDAYDSRANAIDDYVAAFKAQPGQVGVIYRIGGALAGLDIFGSVTTFAGAFAKLVRGSALQALAGFDDGYVSQADDRKFLYAVCNATADRFPAVGLGEEFRFDTEEIGGGALVLHGDLVHLFAYPRRPKDRRSDDRRIDLRAAS